MSISKHKTATQFPVAQELSYMSHTGTYMPGVDLERVSAHTLFLWGNGPQSDCSTNIHFLEMSWQNTGHL